MSKIPSKYMRTHLTNLFSLKRNYIAELDEITDKHPNVVFYGCSVIYPLIVEVWNNYIGRKIDFCCDSDPNKWGKIFCGIKCISPEELIQIKDKCAIFITIGDFMPVLEGLSDRGCPSVNIIHVYDVIAAKYLAVANHDEIIDNLCRTYELLSDEQSKNVFKAIVNRVLDTKTSSNIMRNVCDKHQYFPVDIIQLSEHERFVDIGAFDGDTVRDFVRITKSKFDSVFCFELNNVNYSALQNNVSHMPECGRIEMFNLGIWDSTSDINYNVGQSSSAIGIGNEIGRVAPLDVILKDERVTFIKMDIEGAEPQALRGSKNIILSQRPKLAICIYHDFRHLWEIPLYLKELVPEYKIFLRHHTNLEYETVCYAIA